MIENLQLGLLILDGVTGKILEASECARELLGYSSVELIGNFIWEVAAFNPLIPSVAAYEGLQNQKTLLSEKLSIDTKDGGTRAIKLSFYLFREGNNNLFICQLADFAQGIGIQEVQRQRMQQKDMQIQELGKELERLNHQIEAEIAERQRWAQHLHDAVNQSLFSAGLIAEVLPRLWDRDQTAARRSLEDLRRLTFGAMAEMRVLLAESRPAILADSELGDLLLILGNVVAGRLNIPVSVEAKGKSPIPREIQVALYYLCKELLNIITQRAKAYKITIDVLEDQTKTEIHIVEAGDSFEIPGPASSQYNSFQSALNDANACGVDLEIEPPRDGSAEVVIRWKRRLL